MYIVSYSYSYYNRSGNDNRPAFVHVTHTYEYICGLINKNEGDTN